MSIRLVPLLCILSLTYLCMPQVAQTFDDESLKERVRPSIERGIEYLRKLQLNSGAWAYQVNKGDLSDPKTIGATALAGIALMEAGVPVTDGQIKAAYSIVRQAATNSAMNYTYTMSLCVLFLDRVNRGGSLKHKDAGLIQAIAARIAQGQANNGGWSYNVPSPGSDNSNTQFAVVALWVARKYADKNRGIVDKALALAEKKFRASQQNDGGWAYDPSGVQASLHSTGSMTCAGILGIALSSGAKRETQATFRGAGSSGNSGSVVKQLNEDQQVVKARAFILQSLERTVSNSNDSLHTPPYFLWSLERVATLYRWRKLNGVDWFEIGAKYLMSNQDRAGGWNFGMEDSGVDTSFALLFLSKSNLLGEMEAAFGGGSIGDAQVIPKKKESETKPQNNKEVAKGLSEKLLNALPPQQAEILEALSEGKGSEFTDALVDVIGKLNTNASKEAAREALANRFRRLKTNTLGEYMQENDRELRLAAAVAVRLKNDISGASSLIPLLADQDIGVSTAALDSLKALSGQDFGKSVERWSRWLDTVPKKP